MYNRLFDICYLVLVRFEHHFEGMRASFFHFWVGLNHPMVPAVDPPNFISIGPAVFFFCKLHTDITAHIIE